MAQRWIVVLSCDPPAFDMLRHICSHSRHLVAQSFMISPWPLSHSSAQQRHASAQAWCAYDASGLERAIRVTARTQNAWQSMANS
jgi:hypothetical protein